jgi:hypothetical protein
MRIWLLFLVALSAFADPDLGMEQDEIRESKTQAMGLHLGQGELFFHTALFYDAQLDWNHHLHSQIGSGTFRFRHAGRNVDYENRLIVKGLHSAYRWYFAESLGLFVQGGMGYGLFRSEVRPLGSSVESTDALESQFKGHYLALSTQLGWSHYFENGATLGIAILGFGRHLPFAVKENSDNQDAKSIVIKDISRMHSYGLVNIAVGYAW